MTPFEFATLASNIAIGLGQIGIVWYAIRALTRSAKDRGNDHDKRHTEAMTAHDRRHAEAMTTHDRRHAEAMAAQDKRHAETMAAQDKRHAETMAALDIQRQALETLILRTGQAQPAS